MFSLGPDELTEFGQKLLATDLKRGHHLCVSSCVHGRRDGRSLEISLLGFKEVSQENLKEYMKEAEVTYWQPDPNAKARADILGPIDILKPEFEDVETGLRTWPVCHFMAESLIRNPSMIPEGPVLELGSGLGMLGCVLRDFLSWSHPVVLSEIQNEEFSHVLNFLKANANLNQHPQKPLVVEELWWGASYVEPFKDKLLQNHGIDIRSLGGFTCIIGCDLVYHECAPALMESIDLLLSHAPSAVAYITYPERRDSSIAEFMEKLETMKFRARQRSFVSLCGSLDAENVNIHLDVRAWNTRQRWLKQIVNKLGLHLLEIRRVQKSP
jgi:hypothetical protein